MRSSRQIEELCHTDIAFNVLCADDVPDRATIQRFRARSQEVFAGLFGQVLKIAARAGLARLGTIAIDGTKIAANTSIDANRGGDWFDRQAAKIPTSIVEQANSVDAEADAQARDVGEELHGDRVPATLTDRSADRGRTSPHQLHSATGSIVQVRNELHSRHWTIVS